VPCVSAVEGGVQGFLLRRGEVEHGP